MIKMNSIARKLALGIVTAICCFAFSGCDYDVPITTSPTRKVDERLLGDWADKTGEKILVRRLDDSVYIISLAGELYRAFHSDVAKTAFVSIQDLDHKSRKYTYMTWEVSEDGKQLGLRVVRSRVIPKESKDSASVQMLLEKNLQNEELLEKLESFTKVK